MSTFYERLMQWYHANRIPGGTIQGMLVGLLFVVGNFLLALVFVGSSAETQHLTGWIFGLLNAGFIILLKGQVERLRLENKNRIHADNNRQDRGPIG